jgi:hypothetical protein
MAGRCRHGAGNIVLAAVLGAALLAAACGVHWAPYKPFTLWGTGVPPSDVYQLLLKQARKLDYIVREEDPKRGYFRVMANWSYDPVASQNRVPRFSYFGVNVRPDSSVLISAVGHHVRGKEIHVKLLEELRAFHRVMARALDRARFL